jgi:hypothetical protein
MGDIVPVRTVPTIPHLAKFKQLFFIPGLFPANEFEKVKFTHVIKLL